TRPRSSPRAIRRGASWAGRRVTPTCARSWKRRGTGTARIRAATTIDAEKGTVAIVEEIETPSVPEGLRCFAIDGRVALVTGAGVGIGQAIALALASAGATVGVHYHTSQSGAEQTLELIRSCGGRGLLIQADLTNEEEANRLVDTAVAELGGL